MICARCGTDASPAADICAVCRTPLPGSQAAGAAGADAEATRIADTSAGAAMPSGVTHVLQPGQKFANRYTIIRSLGAGGMAVVYQAWDDTLGVAVALKLIKVEGGSPIELQQLQDRFKRELKLARQVTHPNVVRIHDLGEVGDTLYLTMEYIQGADLAALLHREGRFTLSRTLDIARQLAAGLAAAHKVGVVHRDLKPANVMVTTDGQALLSDFGIARSTTAATVHTMPGAVIGTLEYMSPEQVRGDSVDERSDVYTFGLILYELLAGARPGGERGGSFAEIFSRIQHGPPPVRSVAPDVPPDVEAVVAKCLQLDPAARYQSASDIAVDLDRLGPDGHRLPGTMLGAAAPARVAPWKIASGGIAAAGALVAATLWFSARTAVPSTPEPHAPVSILIADFDNRVQDQVFEGSLEQALGIAMEDAAFITAYPRRDASAVAARQIAPNSRLDERTARLVANREGIRVVLAGAIDREGSAYQLQVTAIDPDQPVGGTPLAVARARADSKGDVLQAVGRVAADLRRALGDTAPSAQHAAETFTASSLEAVRAYTLAQDLASNQRDQEAIEHYREAVRYDPEFGRAYAGWGASAFYLGRRQESEEMWKKALGLMERMTERERLRTMGGYFVNIQRNYAQAIETYRQLVELYPADSAGHSNLAVAYFYTLDFAKALEEGRRAIDIYPRSLKFRSNYALYAMYASDFATAAATAGELVKEDPALDSAYLPLATDALARGDRQAARGVYQKAASTGAAGAISLSSLGLGDLALYEGHPEEAIRVLESGAAADRTAGNTFGEAAKRVALAQAHADAGQSANALRVSEQALALGDDDSILVPIGRMFVAQKRRGEAQKIVGQLSGRLQPQSRAYAGLLEAELALDTGNVVDAITGLERARGLADLWLVHYVLGLAYLRAGDQAAAMRELDICAKRRGEATAMFFDDLPTFRYLAELPYWHARSQEALGLRESATAGYEQYLSVRGGRTEDSLAVDARTRLTALAR